jgi:hypothetical protein
MGHLQAHNIKETNPFMWNIKVMDPITMNVKILRWSRHTNYIRDVQTVVRGK